MVLEAAEQRDDIVGDAVLGVVRWMIRCDLGVILSSAVKQSERQDAHLLDRSDALADSSLAISSSESFSPDP